MLEKIIILCKENNTTITALEKELNFGRCTISKWKKSSPSVEKLKKVADYFGVNITYFLDTTTNDTKD